jgi:hypothetical protein
MSKDDPKGYKEYEIENDPSHKAIMCGICGFWFCYHCYPSGLDDDHCPGLRKDEIN